MCQNTDKNYFTEYGIWFGGYYELAIELGKPSDKRLCRAISALWQYPDLEGCYADNKQEPSTQEKINPSEKRRLYGIATLPKQHKTACGSFVVREDEGSDWLVFYVPVGALEKEYNLNGFPFASANYSEENWEKGNRDFIETFDDWLSKIGLSIYSSIPFRLALIGHETSGETYAADVIQDGISNKRWFGYLWREKNQLKYYPRNIWQPEFTVN